MEPTISPVSTVTPPPTPKEKPSTLTIILFTILGIVILSGAGIGLYYWQFRPADDTADTDTGDEADTGDEGDEGDDAGEGDGEEAAILEYSNEYYPDVLITYDDTWTLDEEVVDGPETGSHNVTATFTKNNHSLVYYMDAVSVYGGVPWCTIAGETDYTQIQGHWARIATADGYSYDNNAIIRGIDYGDGTDIDETIAFAIGEGEDPLDYDFCSDDAPIGTSTSMAIPVGDPSYEPGAMYEGLVSIGLEITGAEDADIVAEADEIVLGTEF